MSDKKGWYNKTCGNCGRVSKRDIGRKYCPFAAVTVHSCMSAENCIYYVRGKFEMPHRRGKDVSEE